MSQGGPRRPVPRLVKALLLLFLVLPGLAAAAGVTEIVALCRETASETCNEVKVLIEFPGAGIEAELLLTFEEALNVSGGGLMVDAVLVDPKDPALLSRLPRGVFIPDDFPVLMTINASPQSGLRFRGAWNLELETENLEFSSHSPLRLFRAEAGMPFQDISENLGAGSYRVRGSSGSFSDFLVVADLRPIDAVVRGKTGRLVRDVEQSAAEIPAIAPTLREFLDHLKIALDAKDAAEAADLLEGLIDYVESERGVGIPDDTRPEDGIVGLTGRLLSGAASLRFSLLSALEAEVGEVGGFRERFQLGNLEFEVFVEFSESFSVDADGLAITAELIDPNAPEILARLPEGVRIPEEFPVLIHMDPVASLGQAFAGLAQFEIRTEAVDFIEDTPLRLFKAPDGGAFEDVTFTFGFGSLKVRGGGRKFSEFVVGLDLRTPEVISAVKIARLRATLDEAAGQIPDSLRSDLGHFVDEAESDLAEHNGRGAIDQLEAFIDKVREAGTDVPSLWRADEEQDSNLTGALLADAESLRFSLKIAERPAAADAGDVNRDGKVDVNDVLLLIDQVFGSQDP